MQALAPKQQESFFGIQQQQDFSGGRSVVTGSGGADAATVLREAKARAIQRAKGTQSVGVQDNLGTPITNTGLQI
jgi:hypothetical protein